MGSKVRAKNDEIERCDQGCVMTVKAIKNIKKGDDITHSYAESLDPILTRQTILTLGKFFAVSK